MHTILRPIICWNTMLSVGTCSLPRHSQSQSTQSHPIPDFTICAIFSLPTRVPISASSLHLHPPYIHTVCIVRKKPRRIYVITGHDSWHRSTYVTHQCLQHDTSMLCNIQVNLEVQCYNTLPLCSVDTSEFTSTRDSAKYDLDTSPATR